MEISVPAVCYIRFVGISGRRLEPSLKIRVELGDKLRQNTLMDLVPNDGELRVFDEIGTLRYQLEQLIPIVFSLATLVGKVGEPKDFGGDSKMFCILHS